MSKVDVNGDKADPLWDYIKKEKPGLMGMKRVYVAPPSPRRRRRLTHKQEVEL